MVRNQLPAQVIKKLGSLRNPRKRVCFGKRWILTSKSRRRLSWSTKLDDPDIFSNHRTSLIVALDMGFAKILAPLKQTRESENVYTWSREIDTFVWTRPSMYK